MTKQSRNILVTGGTGFIGSHLCKALRASGWGVTVLSRSAAGKSPEGVEYVNSLAALEDDGSWHGVINLAGESLNAGRWNAERKAVFANSRVSLTRQLNQWIGGLKQPPAVFLSGSAIGWYGHWQDERLDENSEAHDGFTHQLCASWEAAAADGLPESTRLCVVRIGLVLGPDGGPLPEMLLPARLGLGGALGSGSQWWSWIHIHDLVQLLLFLLENSTMSGPVNGTAPEPVRQKQFARALGAVLNRPAFIPLPSLVAKLLLGEFATELLLNGQRVVPHAATEAGFEFRYADVDSALGDLVAGGS